MTDNQQAEITWRDGVVPVSTRFDDPYFSIEDGLAETEYVFLGGNDLPARFVDGFHIAELGFGTGLNMLAAWNAWLEFGLPGAFRFTSFEAYPMAADDMATALAAFPKMAGMAEPFLELWATGARQFALPGLQAEVIIGDARDTLPAWTGKADAWFLDGFAPAQNPELWQADLLMAVGAKTAPCGTFATYTAAGDVRRGLASAGFTVDRVKGFGRKRHMSIGTLA